MDTEEDGDGGRERRPEPEQAIAAVGGAQGKLVLDGAVAAGWAPPAGVPGGGLPVAVGARVARRPRQALLLLPAFRLQAVTTIKLSYYCILVYLFNGKKEKGVIFK